MVKVEMEKDEKNNLIRLAFESSDIDGLEIIDVVRTAMLGDHPKRGGYLNSNRLIIEVNTKDLDPS